MSNFTLLNLWGEENERYLVFLRPFPDLERPESAQSCALTDQHRCPKVNPQTHSKHRCWEFPVPPGLSGKCQNCKHLRFLWHLMFRSSFCQLSSLWELVFITLLLQNEKCIISFLYFNILSLWLFFFNSFSCTSSYCKKNPPIFIKILAFKGNLICQQICIVIIF